MIDPTEDPSIDWSKVRLDVTPEEIQAESSHVVAALHELWGQCMSGATNLHLPVLVEDKLSCEKCKVSL